jgi:hypothetical protein
MKLRNNGLISRVLVGILITIGVNFNLYPCINCNGAGGGYDDGSSTSESTSTGRGEINSISIEDYIVAGGGYYLKANSEIQTLLRMVEFQEIEGLDYKEFEKVLDRAIGNIHAAIFTYYQLIYKAEVTPYNENVLNKLSQFDYPAFMEKNRLNPYIFKEVEDYLKHGNITGVFRRTYFSFIDIANRLYVIDAWISRGSLPDITVFRELNEISAGVSTFGSYVARSFHALNKNE